MFIRTPISPPGFYFSSKRPPYVPNVFVLSFQKAMTFGGSSFEVFSFDAFDIDMSRCVVYNKFFMRLQKHFRSPRFLALPNIYIPMHSL